MENVLGIGWDVGGWCGDSQGVCLAEEQNGSLELLSAQEESESNLLRDSFKLPNSSSIKSNPVKFFTDQLDLPSIDVNQYQRIVLAIDAPLAFPTKFKQFISSQNEGFTENWILPSDAHIDSPFFFRDCERWIKEEYEKRPMTAVGDSIGNNALVAQLLVDRWRQDEKWCLHPQGEANERTNENQRSIIEVYPATLKCKPDETKEIKGSFENLLPEVDHEIDDDEYDAMICALHALAFAGEFEDLNLCGYEDSINDASSTEGGTGVELDYPLEEGWIYSFEEAKADFEPS